MANYTQLPKAQNAKGKKKSLIKRIFCALIPMRGDGAFEIIRKVIFTGAIVAFVITGGSLLKDLANEWIQINFVNGEIDNLKGSVNLPEEEIEKIEAEVPGIQADFMALYSTNPDVVGWVKINDDINYPVVHGEDNDYYLHHNFKNEEAASGTIFVDYRANISPNPDEQTDNIIIYGHNLWSSTMFSKLTRYAYDKDHLGDPDESNPTLSYYKKYPTIEFDTLYENATYKIFAVCTFNNNYSDGEVYPYTTKQNFESKDDFNNFILDVMDRSYIFPDVDITYGDDIITLSTCYLIMDSEDIRCVVFARKVREGEDPTVDVSKCVVNVNRKLFQREIDYGYGGEWTTRTWDTSKLLSY